MNEENANQEKKTKTNFFSKVWYSITKIEKYPEMASNGFGKAFSYLCKLVIILAIVLCVGTIYQTNTLIKQGVDYLEKDFPDFNYKDGILNVNSEQMLEFSGIESVADKIIIDTKTEDEATINQYIQSVSRFTEME